MDDTVATERRFWKILRGRERHTFRSPIRRITAR
jgi:hypothetical protein